MPSSRGVAYSAQDISRRFALFMPGKGIVRLGRLIPGVAPASALINRDLEALPAGSSEVEFNDVLLSRTFCFFDSKPADVRKTVAALASSGLVVRIMCSAQDCEYLTGKGISSETCISDARYAFPSRNAVVLIYHREFSRMDFRGLKALMVWDGAPQEMRQLLTELMSSTHGAARVAGDDNKFFTVKYRASEKPLGQKLLDSVLYAEKWSLLSAEEKAWRCAFSVLLTLILPIMPVVFALIARGRSKDPSYNLGIMRWQNSVYRDGQLPKSDPYDMLFGDDAEASRRLTDTVNMIASEPGFGYMDSDHRLTEKAKVVSKWHNLLLLASRKQLSRGELALRAVFLVTFATLAIASIAQLSLSSIAHSGASIASAVSYCALIGVCVGSICIYRKDTKRLLMFGTLSFACVALLANSITTFHLGSAPGPVTQSLETIISTALISLFVMYCIAACAANLIYKKDKMVANELGMSFTAYRDIKPQLCSELKNHDRNAANAEVLVRILEDSGEDVATLLARRAASIASVESGEIQQPCAGTSGSASPAADRWWLDPTNPFAADANTEAEEHLGASASGESDTPDISSTLQDVATITKGRSYSSSLDANRPARSA
ncbi:UNVERIFIED_ORG: hypothetical protein C0V67_01905 [Anaplasma ovis]|uniref:Uncharacterized protein n=1 Tax=Anaplasma marginale TaxID=770 RepID=X5DQC0_ANAMA|nr:hypothetical protein [Anaplasma marginale]